MVELIENRHRVDSIQALIQHSDMCVDIDSLRQSEDNFRSLHINHGVIPTIGCEVEIKWSTLFPDVAKKYFGEQDEYGRFEIGYEELSDSAKSSLNEECIEIDRVIIPKFEATLKAGVPRGVDAYWEFANSPAFSHNILSAEVAVLQELGLIPEGFDHSLHITLGNLANKGGGVELILTGLELMYANPLRIKAATFPNKYGGKSVWARRGRDGVRRRLGSELDLNSYTASELRTLSLSGQINDNNVFNSAQLLGSLLLMHREQCGIGKEWESYRRIARRAIESAGLPISSWGAPHRKENKSKWLAWADFIGGREDTGSIQADLVMAIQALENKVEDYLAQTSSS